MPVNQIMDVTKFHDDVGINAIDIQTSYLDQAGLYAHYASLLLRAELQTGNLKIVRDIQAAKIDQEIREAAQAVAETALTADPKAKIERLTEGAITAKRNIDKRYIAVVKDHMQAEAIETFMKNSLEALKQRKDMLVSLGSTQREERKGDLRLLEKASTSTEALKARAHQVLENLTQEKAA